MSAQPVLSVDYLPLCPLASHDGAWWANVLGIGLFADAPSRFQAPGVPVAEVLAPPLGDTGALCEVWRTAAPLRAGEFGPIRYRASPHVLFGCITGSEQPAADGQARAATPLQAATRNAYAEIFKALDALGFNHLIRVWNYFADINAETHGAERYRQFNRARHDAFRDNRRAIEHQVPAACALGSPAGGPLVIYFLASPIEARPLENPRQVSAFHYPEQYGPRPPTFSRATIAHELLGGPLLISGTASIVGHETRHPGNARAQTRETLANIEALIEEANQATGTARYRLDRLQFKVYVREPRDLPVIRAEMNAALGPAARVIYVQADVCRSELLLEIEAASTGPDLFRD